MTQLSTSHTGSHLSADVIQEIVDAVTNIDYGSVEVVIHDGKVVQIECRKKIRVNHSGTGRKVLKSGA